MCHRVQEAWDAWLSSSVRDLREKHLLRILRPTIPSLSPVEVLVRVADLDAWVAGEPVPPPAAAVTSLAQQAEMRTVKLFSLNDYLGLATHPEVCRAASEATLACGNGPRSSALVGGYTCWHRDLEAALAQLKGTEDCLLFPTGFAANLAVVSALCGGGDVAVFSDELNHASIVDGVRLGRQQGSTLQVYRHNDLQHLDSLLSAAPPGMRKLVVTDTLFSMDGDFADLQGLAALRRKHGFLLAVDDAHGTLVCGESGAGAAEMQGVPHDAIDLHVGTLSKAVGSMGGFVACSARWKELFVNRGRAQVFSTALAVPAVAAAHAALRVAAQEPWRRRHVWSLAKQVGRALGVPAHSPIVPLVIGPEDATMAAGAALLARGLHVPAIRPPTVPRGTSRLRVSLSAGHSVRDVQQLVEVLRGCGVEFRGVKGRGGVMEGESLAGSWGSQARPGQSGGDAGSEVGGLQGGAVQSKL